MKPAICTQCGGNIEVDETKELGICQYCGTPFVTERVINNYVTQNVHNITQNVTKVIYGNEKDEGEDYFRRALTFIDLEDWGAACDTLAKATKLSPQNAEYWFYCVVAHTKNFTSTEDFFHDEYDRCYGGNLIYENAKKFFKIATEENKKILGERFGFSLTGITEFFLDIVERTGPNDWGILIYPYQNTKWNRQNKDLFNRIWAFFLSHNTTPCRGNELITEEAFSLLNDENKALLKRIYANRTYVYYGSEVRISSYDAWWGEETVRLAPPKAVSSVHFMTPDPLERKVIIPATFKKVYGSVARIRCVELEEGVFDPLLLSTVLTNLRPEVLYLHSRCQHTMSIPKITFWNPELTVFVCPDYCSIKVTCTSDRSVYWVGGVFGNQIVYPRNASTSTLKAFNAILMRNFGNEIESGTFTGYLTDADIDAGVKPPKYRPKDGEKKPGFFARLFGKK